MSRSADIECFSKSTAAASAGTLYLYFPIPTTSTTDPTSGPKAFMFEGYGWGYQTAEANTDNTFDFVIEYDSVGDGTYATALHTNVNPNGLLDSATLGQFLFNKGNAAISGGAAVAALPVRARVPAGGNIRVTCITAGTSTVPGINFAIMGHFV